MKIQNRTFVVSGGSSGLGLATVQELLKCGAWVSILDQRPLPHSAFPVHAVLTPHQLSQSPSSSSSSSSPSTSSSTTTVDAPRILFHNVDIAISTQVQAAVNSTMHWINKTGKTLGGVINCAGMGMNELMVNSKGKEHSLEIWDRTIATNLTGTFNLTRLVLKHLSAIPLPPEDCANEGNSDGERGVVILTSSSTAYEGPPGQVAYAASKGAISSMALPMARDCARWGIRVVSIAPSSFETPLIQSLSEKVRTGLSRDGVLFPKRYGHPREFAATVRWILETSYVNGEDIRLSGGGRVPAWL